MKDTSLAMALVQMQSADEFLRREQILSFANEDRHKAIQSVRNKLSNAMEAWRYEFDKEKT